MGAAASTAEQSETGFVVKTCALSAIATGQKAENLKELLQILHTIDIDCIYYHFYGGLLRPRFDDPEYSNDFAAWVEHALHDDRLAERLGIIDPARFVDLEDLRRELIDVIEERLDEQFKTPWSARDEQFYFIRSQIVVLETGDVLSKPAELANAVPKLSLGSIFYHVIDARRRNADCRDDFCAWLSGLPGQEDLVRDLGDIDIYFRSLTDLRDRFAETLQRRLGGAS
ncbi:MAG: hypothetical protein HKN20_15850 [Gemmatimonadetes bacterium]|nr:hypothetical protein [Gemmatimonadota bacterium]